MITAHFNEEHAIAATIDPQAVDNASQTSDWVDMSKYNRVAFIVCVGATDTTVDIKLQSATADDGTGAADISGKAATQLTATDDNKQVVIEITAEEMPANTGYCAAVVTAGDGTSGALVCAVGLGTVARYAPVSHLASVAEAVV
jgi:hypothetical protein